MQDVTEFVLIEYLFVLLFVELASFQFITAEVG